MEQTGSQRVACYDVLRVAATFAVVALHLSAQHWADTDIYSTAWQAFNLYDSLVRWTVPVFVMISGVFFLAAFEIGKDGFVHFGKINQHFGVLLFGISWNTRMPVRGRTGSSAPTDGRINRPS